MGLNSDKFIRTLQRDMTDSLKLTRYVAFASDLITIVNIFIELGHTQCHKNAKDDKQWAKLNANVQAAVQKQQNMQHESISLAAKLFRDIKDSINLEFAEANTRWVRTV